MLILFGIPILSDFGVKMAPVPFLVLIYSILGIWINFLPSEISAAFALEQIKKLKLMKTWTYSYTIYYTGNRAKFGNQTW